MAINTIAYAAKLQSIADQQMQAKLTSGWMEGNAKRVVYNGGKTVKIGTVSTTGLGDYDRDNGFPQGSVALVYKDYEMTQDRGATFQLDSQDVDESNFLLNAASVTGDFQTNHVAPEIDSYRYSKIANLGINANVASGGNTVNVSNVLSLLDADITAIQDIVGDIPLVITMSTTIRSVLNNNEKIQKQINAADFTNGAITTKVLSYNGIPIIGVPSSRMKTVYTFNDGKTTGQTQGGFVAAGTAKNINWLITPVAAPLAINKADISRIFDPMTNQKADAWKIDYRKYHDLWVTDEWLKLCRVNIKEALS
ncbi:hypothetical protein [Clostridium saccharoperbutylacetonicum]|uniref:hypothetical protein n=1 Tax=Clostridium saccharoperbutylacetonicum TaxID=36745 RepID=UPI0039E765C9